VFLICAAVLVVVSFGLGQYWQYEIRKLMGVTDYNIAYVVASPLVAALVFCLFLLIGRGLRGLFRWVARLMSRWIGRRAARAIGWILVAGLTYLVVTGLLLQGLVDALNSAYSVRDTKTAEGIHQPTTSLRSGGPGSVLPWDTLSWQGRNFIGLGPSVSDIEKLGRAYRGADPCLTPGWRRLTTPRRGQPGGQDLERTGAFKRKNLLVVTTTGSGWVDLALWTPSSTSPRRQRHGGDPVLLPAVLGLYLVDQSKAREAGRALFDAVYGAWSDVPRAASRLFVAGRASGRSAARPRSAASSLANLTSGALFAFAQLQHAVPGVQRPPRQRKPRDAAGLSGRTDRSGSPATRARTYRLTASPWTGSRVLYMMHPSDPIVCGART
jgi:uncharacterized membrane protein